MKLKYIIIALWILLTLDGIIIVYGAAKTQAITYNLTLSSTTVDDAFEAINTYLLTITSTIIEDVFEGIGTYDLTLFSTVWDTLAKTANLSYNLVLSSNIVTTNINSTFIKTYNMEIATTIRDVAPIGGNGIIGLPNPRPQIDDVNNVIFHPNSMVIPLIAIILILGWALIFRKD